MSFISNGRYFTDLEDLILPSMCTERWLQFDQPAEEYNLAYTGKWMLFTPILDDHDKQWPLLKRALNDGLLGIGIKASTALSTREDHLTCVYTKDYQDIDDVRRVLISLRNLGFHGRLAYKTDEQTRGLVSGSLYWSPPDSTEVIVTKAGRQFLALLDEYSNGL